MNFPKWNIWVEDNPHTIRPGHNQHQFSINVQVRIIDDLIGPCILPVNLTGPQYLRFLCRHLPQMLEDVPLRTKQMWFMHDGAPGHFSLAVQEWLGRHYLGYRISCSPDVLVPWPP
jgi:hypothetical protein